MTNSTFIKTAAILTGLVIAGEALALFVGMHLLGAGQPAWISPKNDLLLGLDVLAGLGLIVLTARSHSTLELGLLYAILIVSLGIHGYREWEYVAGVAGRFCANLPLFVINNLKLAGLLAVLIGDLRSRFTR